jgi:hypothetical protein
LTIILFALLLVVQQEKIMRKISFQEAVQATLAGDKATTAAYERQQSKLKFAEAPPIFLSGDEVSNPPSWAKGKKVTDGKTVWVA